MDFIRVILFTALLVVGSPFASAQSHFKKWPNQKCSDLYKAIGFFTAIAHKEWEEKNEEKGALYASVAADYATIYQTVCKK